jgi:hypothetical protein
MVEVTYTYYTDTYLGTILSTEPLFDKYLADAVDYVNARTFGNANEVTDDDVNAPKVKRALCKIADLLKVNVTDTGYINGVVTSESVGSTWSKSYKVDNSARPEDVLDKQLCLILYNTGLLYGGVE